MKSEQQPSKQDYSQPSKFVAYLSSGLFILLGTAAIIWLLISILQNPALQEAVNHTGLTNGDSPSVILTFLIELGIVVPLLVISFSALMFLLAFKLQSQNIKAARWAQVVLTWLDVGLVIVLILNVFQIASANFFPGPGEEPTLDLGLITLSAILLGIIAVLSLGLWWFRKHIKVFFQGTDSLKYRDRRMAWNLLIPTLVVFVFIAARPLEQTFIRSLTNKRFASPEVPAFVGLDNYQDLLTFRLDTVECRVDEETDDCILAGDGSIRWQSIDRTYLEDGFRTVWTLKLPFNDTPTALAISGMDSDFLQAIWTTIIFTVISVSLELTIGLFIAMTVNSKFPGRGMMRAVMLVPWAIPTVISARLWEVMLKDTSAGIFNRILLDVGLIESPQAWLTLSNLQVPSAIMVDVWKTTPFMALLLLAGLQTIPKDLYEAASVDGANKIQQFLSVTLPLLRPTIAVALVFRTLDALRVFDLFNVLFGRQQLTMATLNYEMLVNNRQDGYASAISIIIFLLISIFAFIYVRLLNVET